MTEQEAKEKGWRLERAPARDEEGYDPWGGEERPWLLISETTGLPLTGGRTKQEALAALDAQLSKAARRDRSATPG